jgi:polyketide synthase PksN/surfactin family lipopeptide synthetase A
MDRQTSANIVKLLKNSGTNSRADIAIIGMAANLPSASGMDEFWNNIVNGIDCIRSFPESRKKDIDNYVYYSKLEPYGQVHYMDGAYIEEIDKFDYNLFKMTPMEASLMDPYQRVFLQTVWNAIEDAGYGGKKLAKSNTGVYLGYGSNAKDSYQKMIYDLDPTLLGLSAVGNTIAMMPSRISYLLDLRGPTMVLDTACSSSLVAVHLACQALKNKDCEMAIAGGLRINLLPFNKDYMKTGFESSDGRTRTFDENSDGAGMGEGVISLLLKPLNKAKQDRDNIYAVIKGSAINQDGASLGITAPNPDAQTDVILKAWEDAGINPDTLAYIEAHGTGTKLGDPIEIQGLQRAFSKYTDRKQFCAISTVKTNIGHLYESSGMAGILKAVQSLQKKVIPPANYFNRPNSKINFSNSPLYINTRAREWEEREGLRRCAVSSFGFSGTNCHLVLEEAPPPAAYSGDEGLQILTLSGKSRAVLQDLLQSYHQFSGNHKEMELLDICYTANTGRGHYGNRLALIAKDKTDFNNKISVLCNLGFEQENMQIYYGEHKLVPPGKTVKAAYEITDREKNEKNRKATALVEAFLVSGRSDETILDEICQLYTSGADIAWETFYQDTKARKVKLPRYPMERIRCWLDVPDMAGQAEIPAGQELYFELGWKMETANLKRRPKPSGSILIFRDESELGRELVLRYRKEGQDVIEVCMADAFQQCDSGGYTIKNQAKDY